jgi:hypothetical protein
MSSAERVRRHRAGKANGTPGPKRPLATVADAMRYAGATLNELGFFAACDFEDREMDLLGQLERRIRDLRDERKSLQKADHAR